MGIKLKLYHIFQAGINDDYNDMLGRFKNLKGSILIYFYNFSFLFFSTLAPWSFLHTNAGILICELTVFRCYLNLKFFS